MFVDRLVLQMRKVDDPGTRAAISTLIFQHDPKTGANSSSDSAESVDFSLGLDTYFDSRQKTDLELDECTTVVHEDRDEGHPERLV
ncbi:hypothetical protein FA13DRAFT_1743148 [Coprinellus micaceus]|uniref:Uncharacterized protein n=1 Tax=Coprinellus micaceus TaxID=71717 RepID=A0A4Y7SFS1_COPMI|nr:hypothetical protein FA13DRAFT_1743148 [Coprinellus micaceus]